MPEDESVCFPLVDAVGDCGSNWPDPPPAPHRSISPSTNPSALSPPPSVFLGALFQFDPQNLRDFFLQLHQPLGALRSPLKPQILPLQFPYPLRYRVFLPPLPPSSPVRRLAPSCLAHFASSP